VSDFARKPTRSSTVVVRVTDDQKRLIESLVEPLGVRGMADVVRLMADYFIEHAPEGRAAAKKLRGGK
jgi:hypothetical protein